MPFRRRILGIAFLVAFVGVAGALAWLFLREDGRGGASGNVPVYFTVPDFSLTGRSGRLVRRADLLGKVWVADFFYTQCKDTCPLQT
ncbi:MAG: SCO family protein, partial [bacterium]